MKQDEIIAMARQAGIVFDDRAFPFYEAFAKLVAAKKDAEHKEAMRWDIHTCGPTCKRYACVATREAVKAEREACIEMEKDLAASPALFATMNEWHGYKRGIETFIAAIRARGEA